MDGLPRIGTKYALGETDCFALVLNYLKANGYIVPSEFNGATRENYSELFLADKRRATTLMERFIESELREVRKHEARPGDVLLLRGNPKFLAVEVGNAKIVTACPEMGVILDNKINYEVERVFRWEGT